ncbi:threonine ammonia-lyase [Nocardia puris]|uniref:threonine ammonia-lyase n=1 Tax=Nocardia puris TaxID=208602 RepID=A0A366DJB7_9NOCA|nr:threonine ammonia-lyase [Nocardia puris]MBF6213420.1 threonine ammonia-lyase [Nocardia puris]MBF6369411.1 threonine ammonia-lyase [Nocardia puris]MBF6462300.1 threonine ammonia-lyase [Nocardia puris]RBO89609.1 threonine dehydratase [Nocardia puris]
MELIGLGRIEAAAELLAPVIRRTPVVASRVLSQRCGAQVWLKCENLQRTGSFKPRGAYNRIAHLPPEERGRGVVAASAGNHAQGVAWAAATLGIDSTVFMPVGASLPKLAATKAYGAQVRQVGATIDEALDAALDFAAHTGATLIHPFDHPDIVSGQATVGLEILEQLPDVGTVLVPTGGGGLLAGVALALAELAPDVRVIGVQAAEAAAWPVSLTEGKPVRAQRLSTMADGIAVGLPGEVPFAHVTAHRPTIVTVDEEALSTALLLCLERAKLIVEPAGAAAVAALMSLPPGELDLREPVCAILSGGNIDPLLLTRLIGHGLSVAGRYLALRVTISDRPGALGGLLSVVGATGASVVDVVHSRTGTWLAVDEVEVGLTLETRGPDHRDTVSDALERAGYAVRAQD